MRIDASIRGPRGKMFPCVIEVDIGRGCAMIVEGFGTGYEWGWKPMKARPWITWSEAASDERT